MRPRPVRPSRSPRVVHRRAVRPTSGGIGCAGWSLMVVGAVVLAGLLRFSHQDQKERRLLNLGGEVYYARGERATLLAERLQNSGSQRIGELAPSLVDKMFGKLVAVHLGRLADLRGTDPNEVVKAIGDAPHLRTVVIDGVPLRDPHLLRLTEAPALKELGLLNTEVTAEGVAAARAKNPSLLITWPGDPAPKPSPKAPPKEDIPEAEKGQNHGSLLPGPPEYKLDRAIEAGGVALAAKKDEI